MRRKVVKWLLPVLLSFVLCTLGAFADDRMAEDLPFSAEEGTEEIFSPAEEDAGEGQAQTEPAENEEDAEMPFGQDSDAEPSDIGADPAEQAPAEESRTAETDGTGQTGDHVFAEEENLETDVAVEGPGEDYGASWNREDVSEGADVPSGSDEGTEMTDDDPAGDRTEEAVHSDVGMGGMTDEEDTPYGECGKTEDTVFWEIAADGILMIYGNGEMQDYSSPEAAPWSPYTTEVAAIVITDGVISIGDYAFSSLQSFSDIEIAESVRYIGDNAFRNCSGLKEVMIGL